jgi:hypothetical protein
MNANANREGFRILRRDSALLPMELLWRWSFGLGLLALLFGVYAHLRQAVLFSEADQLALSSQDPLAISAAVNGLIAEIGPLLLGPLSQIAGFAAMLWIASAALGRSIITRIIVRRFAADYGVTVAPDAPRWVWFATLNFARVLMLLIFVIGYLGGAFVAGLANGPGQSLLASALIIFGALAASTVVWSYVNWVLSLAPLFTVRDGLAPLDSVVAAIAFIGRNRSRLAAIALWNSTLRGLMATVISIAVVCTVALRPALSPGISTALLVLETLAYLLISDIFLLARLGAYASVSVRELSLSQSLAGAADRSGTLSH